MRVFIDSLNFAAAASETCRQTEQDANLAQPYKGSLVFGEPLNFLFHNSRILIVTALLIN